MIKAFITTPQDELGGLSPEQVFRLIYTEWDYNGPSHGPAGKTGEQAELPLGSEPGLRLNSGIDLPDLGSAWFFHNCRAFLLELQMEDGVRTTQAGNLPRSFVKVMWRKIKVQELVLDYFDRYRKVVNEMDVWPLHKARIVCQCGGLIRRYRGRFLVTRKYEHLLEDGCAGRLFAHLFNTYFRMFNISYSNMLPECPYVQRTVAYKLYRLGRVACRWASVSHLPVQVLLPYVRDKIEEVAIRYLDETDYLILQVLEPLSSFGLILTGE